MIKKLLKLIYEAIGKMVVKKKLSSKKVKKQEQNGKKCQIMTQKDLMFNVVKNRNGQLLEMKVMK